MGNFFAALLFTILCLGAVAGSASAASIVYNSSTPEGWFWYNLPPEPEEPEEPEARPEPPKKDEQPPDAIAPKPQSPTQPSGPAPYSSAWLREYLPKYRERAIDSPTRKNVLAYMYLQRLTMDKAQRFTQAVQSAVKTTPFLDESTRRPLNTLGAKLADRRSDQARRVVLQKLSDRFAIWFFYSGTQACPYCASQASILYDVNALYGFHVTAISMDGSAPAKTFDDVKMDQGQAKQLGVDSPLAVVLVNPKRKAIVPLSHGLLAQPQVLERILLAAHSEGWISDDLYDKTLPVSQKNLLTADALRSDEPTQNTRQAPSDALPIDPSYVVERMQQGATIWDGGHR